MLQRRVRAMSCPEPIAGTWAVVTGASAGIGEQLARRLAERGHDLMLVARRRDRLEALADQLRARHGVATEAITCDLTDGAELETFAQSLAEREVSLLCNNAGCGLFGDLRGADPARVRELALINVNAVQELTLAVLPGMLARGSGALLITGSTAGHQPFPGATTYAASKAFVNTFAESLHAELAGTGVTCTLFAPGPVATEFYRVACRSGLVDTVLGTVSMSATVAAAQALSGVAARRRTVVPGVVAKLQTVGGRHTPRRVLLPLLYRVARFLA